MDEITSQAIGLSDWPEPIVTAAAVEALTAHDGEISRALCEGTRETLVAEKLLVFRNLASVVYRNAVQPVGREVGDLGRKCWVGLKDGSEDGFRDLGKKAPTMLVAFLLGGPYLAIAAMMGGTTFDQVKKAFDWLKSQYGDDQKG